MATIPEEMSAEAKGLMANARERAEELRAAMRERAQTLSQKSVSELWTDARTYVRDNPGKSMLAALALGVCIGGWLRRR
jgi:ElaB/YqjD/DUF883 family membrane-anchored ribosome-binding protein